jgi:hypothetical protein
MTLRRCGAAPAVLCVSAVRERVPGARFVALCPPFAWQAVCSTFRASVFICASLIDFYAERNLSSRTRLWSVRSAQLVRSQCSTISVTQRIDQA